MENAEVKESYGHPERVVVTRSGCQLRVYARSDRCGTDWQSQWIATDIWIAMSPKLSPENFAARTSSISKIQDART